MLVLNPKRNVDTRGIGLLEVVWKVVEAVINTIITSVVQLNNVLHEFFSGSGTGAAVVELKLVQ